MPSLGASSNFYRETKTLPSFLTAITAGYFDDVVMVHAPPEGAKPDDESIEMVKKAGVRLVHTTINKGFGAVRTRCIRESKAEWVMILDCDERFFENAPVFSCEGTEGYPQFKNPKLTLRREQESYPQGQVLKEIIASNGSNIDAVCLGRRHWFDEPGKLQKPCQNFSTIADWQLRCVRNSQYIAYDYHHRMHEKIIDTRTWSEPRFHRGNQMEGPWIDHFSLFYKDQTPEKNKEDAATYEMLDKGSVNNMWLGSVKGVGDAS